MSNMSKKRAQSIQSQGCGVVRAYSPQLNYAIFPSRCQVSVRPLKELVEELHLGEGRTNPELHCGSTAAGEREQYGRYGQRCWCDQAEWYQWDLSGTFLWQLKISQSQSLDRVERNRCAQCWQLSLTAVRWRVMARSATSCAWARTCLSMVSAVPASRYHLRGHCLTMSSVCRVFPWKRTLRTPRMLWKELKQQGLYDVINVTVYDDLQRTTGKIPSWCC